MFICLQFQFYISNNNIYGTSSVSLVLRKKLYKINFLTILYFSILRRKKVPKVLFIVSTALPVPFLHRTYFPFPVNYVRRASEQEKQTKIVWKTGNVNIKYINKQSLLGSFVSTRKRNLTQVVIATHYLLLTYSYIFTFYRNKVLVNL